MSQWNNNNNKKKKSTSTSAKLLHCCRVYTVCIPLSSQILAARLQPLGIKMAVSLGSF